MHLSFVIVDDDAVSRRMLHTIIENSGLGEVTGTAADGMEGLRLILDTKPDVVLVDLLMPGQDGIATVKQMREFGFEGKSIMISQVVNKEMVGLAYQAGIEFFIHKPINRVEVEAVLQKVSERRFYERHIQEIKQSLAKLELIERAGFPEQTRAKRTVRDVAKLILMDLGILGESGSKDIIALMEYLAAEPDHGTFPSLKEMYEAVAGSYKVGRQEIDKEVKAIEQRIRRAVAAALSHLASIGLTDYSNPKFEYYAPLYFDFQNVRLRMRMMEEDEDSNSDKGKVNIKKFLQVFHLDLLEKMKHG